MTLNLSPEEVQFIFNVLGELPSKSGAFPLMMKIKEQADAQTPDANPTEAGKAAA